MSTKPAKPTRVHFVEEHGSGVQSHNQDSVDQREEQGSGEQHVVIGGHAAVQEQAVVVYAANALLAHAAVLYVFGVHDLRGRSRSLLRLKKASRESTARGWQTSRTEIVDATTISCKIRESN